MAAVMKTSGLAGLLTGAVALGVAELTAAVTGPNGAPVIAVGETAINLTPVPVKEFAIAHFGTHDKAALVAGILMLLAAFAALIGVLAVRRLAYGLAALAVFGRGRRRGRGQPGGRPQRGADAGWHGRGGRDAGADGARDTGRPGQRGPRGGDGASGGTGRQGARAPPLPDRGGGSGGPRRGGRRPG